MRKNKKHILTDKKTIFKLESSHAIVAQKIKTKRIQTASVTDFVNNIRKGNIAYLSKAITLIESNKEHHQEKANKILEACLPFAHHSIRIGVTGVPGVGKSTFIESFGNYLITQNKKIAVLAIDPTSTLQKGSVLGDKTRMGTLVNNQQVFIRPSPAGTSLGGVARKTRESILLCEAAGFDTIIIETVGVGQSETTVHSMVDFFLLLKIAGAGDELQGIKRGIIEMADAIVIHKSDGDNIEHAKIAQSAFSKALHLYPPKSNGWQPKVLVASALKNTGIKEVGELIFEYIELLKKKGIFLEKRVHQNEFWLHSTIKAVLEENFFNHPEIQKQLIITDKFLKEGKTTPYLAAKNLLKLYK